MKSRTPPKKMAKSAKSAKWLILVESPSKCAKIEGFLGPEYCCIATKGHIRYISGLKSIDLDCNSSDDIVKYDIIEDKKKHISFLQEMVDKFQRQQKDQNRILLATDDDREGEAIAWHICQVCKLDPVGTPRIIFHEITQPALHHAVANPTRINMALVNAQRARQVLDLLVGYKVSPLLWKRFYTANGEKTLSAGRCQTPALRLVYDNECDKMKTASTFPYKTVATFFAGAALTNPVRQMQFVLNREWQSADQVTYFLQESQTFQHHTKLHKSTVVKKAAPKPLTTSRLLQQAANELHMSPQQTMAQCQKLYQEGWITYMRTESTKYSAVFLDEARAYIEANYADKMSSNTKSPVGDLQKICMDNEEDTNPHEAIRVTHIDATEYTNNHQEDDDEHSNDQKKEDSRTTIKTLYRMIHRITVESCMCDAEYMATKVTISAPIDAEYIHTIEIPTNLGWKSVLENAKKNQKYKKQTDKSESCDSSSGSAMILYLTSISPTADVQYQRIDCTVIAKRDHSHYSEATLIHALEELGIGRPSTFATLVETIQTRGYVKCQDVEGEEIAVREFHLLNTDVGRNTNGIKEKEIRMEEKIRVFGSEKKKLVLQPLGKMTIEFLCEYFDTLFSYDYTKRMECDLDMISISDSISWQQVCKECNQQLMEWIRAVSKISKETFPIKDEGSQTVVVFEKYGPVIRRTLSDSKTKESKDSKNTKNSKTKESNKSNYSFESIRKDITLDLAKLKAGEYTLEDLISPVIELEDGITIKTGKYGDYVEWKSSVVGVVSSEEIQHKSLKGFTGSKENMDDLREFIEGKEATDGDKKRSPNLLRVLNENISIRKGKTGPYIFYKTASMHKPQFFPLKSFPIDTLYSCSCDHFLDWIKTNHSIK